MILKSIILEVIFRKHLILLMMHLLIMEGITFLSKSFFFAYDIFILQNLIRRIIVNCARGISRSATIVIAYLMYKFKMRYDDAFELLIKLRPQVRPNSNFRYQLKLYEKELISNRYYNTNLTSIVATSTIKKK